jgi:threonine/homoserine/homoserine lactone efflux protein
MEEGGRYAVDLASVLTLALLALFLAAQPWSVLAAVLLATARGGMRKELAFVGGWITALAAVAAATVLVYPDLAHTSTSSRGLAAVEVAAGLVLGGWLAMRWRHPKDPGTDRQPSWMGRRDAMPPWLAFGLGVFLPSYAVVVAAVSEMLSSGLSQGWLLAVAVVWVLLASVGVGAPLMLLMTDRDHAPETYQRWRSWIVTHSRAVLYGVGAVVSVVLIVKGAAGLVG